MFHADGTTVTAKIDGYAKRVVILRGVIGHFAECRHAFSGELLRPARIEHAYDVRDIETGSEYRTIPASDIDPPEPTHFVCAPAKGSR